MREKLLLAATITFLLQLFMGAGWPVRMHKSDLSRSSLVDAQRVETLPAKSIIGLFNRTKSNPSVE